MAQHCSTDRRSLITYQSSTLRLLWLKTNLLHPVDTGGKIRTYFMLRELKQRHHVTYLGLDDAVERAAEYCHEVNIV